MNDNDRAKREETKETLELPDKVTRTHDTCSALTKRGTRCRAAAVIGSPFCALHADPARAANLGRMGGRRNRHYVEASDRTISAPSTPEEVKNVLAQVMADVYAGKMHPRTAYALTQVATPLLRAMEDTDLQHRLDRMEAELQSTSGESEGGQTIQGDVDEPLGSHAEAQLDTH